MYLVHGWANGDKYNMQLHHLAYAGTTMLSHLQQKANRPM